MFTQISQKALRVLVEEMRAENFTSRVLNRLKNEDPTYDHVATFFAAKAKERLGREGSRLALDHFAIVYRLIELSERYPMQKLLAQNDAEQDVPPSAEQAASAAAEFAACVKRWSKPFDK